MVRYWTPEATLLGLCKHGADNIRTHFSLLSTTDPVKSSTLRYEPGVDGIRAFAVLAVVAYHFGWLSTPGGFLGVDVFFTISGFLITSLLVSEYRRTGRIDVREFWKRRARRLLPALFVFLAVTAAYVAAFVPTEIDRVQRELFPALGYFTNWFLIGYNESYFETFARPSLWRHLWSLAVEEQFYIVWPVLFVFLRRVRTTLIVGLIGVLALASTWWMANLFVPFEDPSRVYYGTDTRATGILVGAILGLLRHRLPVIEHKRRWPLFVGVTGLGTLIWMVVAVNDFDPWLYQGGFLLTAAASTAAIIGVVGSRSLRSIVGSAPMRWVGLRSYGLYMWHWPVVVFTRPNIDVFWDPTVVTLVRLVGALILTEISYRWIEMPARNGALGRWWQRVRSGRERLVPRSAWRVVVTTYIALFSMPLAIVLASPPPEAPAFREEVAMIQTSEMPLTATPIPLTAFPTTSLPTTTVPTTTVPTTSVPTTSVPTTSVPTTAPETVRRTMPPRAREPATTPEPATVFAIGDSVMLGAVGELQAAFGGAIEVDALKARSWTNGIEVLRARFRDGNVDDIVIVHLGYNGPVNSDMLDALIDATTGVRRVYILTIQIDRRWESRINELIRERAGSVAVMRVIEWKLLAESDRSLLGRDNIHLSPDGQRVYAELIASAVGDITSCAATTSCVNEAAR
ncbi:O-acetyltransferase OatA [bacterium BMS3Bbin02]|nr:O-acetyltransferase OatA [bacterium BMS3Bbin02]